jgi:aspartate/methionine/tyrosine aminotransferase
MNLPPFPLVDWFAFAEGKYDLSLSHSDCEPLAVSDVLGEHELAEFSQRRLGYGPFAGLAELRNVVSRQYSTIDDAGVLIFNGVSEAIYTFMRSVLQPNDQIVVQSPLFNILHGVARSIGCRLVEWRPSDEATCTFDVATLPDLCKAQTKLIVFNFPYNPTGQVISEPELRLILDTAAKCGAYVFSDEQFRLLEMPSVRTLPAACDLYERAVSTAGLSKTLGLGGLRIGWLATRCREVISAARSYRFYTTETTNSPCQVLACHALQHGEQIIAHNRSQIASNIELLRSFTADRPDVLRLQVPQGGTMAIVEQNTTLTSTEFCERLLNDERVFLVPGKALSFPDRVMRFGLGRRDFAEGLQRLGRFLDRLDCT